MAVDSKSVVNELRSLPDAEQKERGYFHTLREILQQPATWRETAREMAAISRELHAQVDGIRAMVLTGSGSSLYAGELVAPFLRARLRRTVQAVSGGDLVVFGSEAIPAGRPALMVSIARSGESPESAGAVSSILDAERDVRHLIITANRDSPLAKDFASDPRVSVVTLADATCDRSLVMTSSFTNLALAAFALGEDSEYAGAVERLAKATEQLQAKHADTLARVAETGFRRAVYLGSGSNFGAAREGALKMLEMTAGRVGTIAETYLGLRHGPMSYVDSETLMVCFLSGDPLVRAYEADLVREINRKQLGAMKVISGVDVPDDLVGANDVVLEDGALEGFRDGYAALRNVVSAQFLGFFRCRAEGLRPDSPSDEGVINRVVESFTLHGADGRGQGE